MVCQYFENGSFSTSSHIVHVTQESNHNENIPKLEAACRCLNLKQTKTPKEATMKLSGYSTRGSVWGVSTEAITTVHLGQKYNLESPNRVNFYFPERQQRSWVQKNGAEILSAVQEKLHQMQGTTDADRTWQPTTQAFMQYQSETISYISVLTFTLECLILNVRLLKNI